MLSIFWKQLAGVLLQKRKYTQNLVKSDQNNIFYQNRKRQGGGQRKMHKNLIKLQQIYIFFNTFGGGGWGELHVLAMIYIQHFCYIKDNQSKKYNLNIKFIKQYTWG
eukprot:TRINITY_DN16383_c0_g1_i10.p5 TRINITY_DN16383_c0_g1~~TRINITY_DN16383_c0_g1_i10.p5  ORF type:complete len:107 (+),score=3.86 TRINITY_DN16383_c0_g1_i10:273-593(+)